MGIGVWELVLLLLIVLVLFGTKKLGSIGADLGSAIKGFRKALGDENPDPTPTDNPAGQPDCTAQPPESRKPPSPREKVG